MQSILIIKEMKKGYYWTRVIKSRKTALLALLIYLFLGTLFYRYYDELSWAHAYYLAVNNGLRIGFVTGLKEKNHQAKLFSIFFKLVGVAILALLYTNMFRSNYFQTIEVRRNRVNVALTIAVLLVVFGAVWSFQVVDWSAINSLYFVAATYWWWGIYSLPTDSSDIVFAIASTSAIIGGISVFVLYGLISSDVEILIEKYILKTVALQAFTSEELGIVHNLMNNKSRSNMPRGSIGGSSSVSASSSCESAATGALSPIAPLSIPLANSNMSELDEHMVKHILLGRVLTIDDISIVYYHMRIQLLITLAVLLVLSSIFYRYYDDSGDWSTQ